MQVSGAPEECLDLFALDVKALRFFETSVDKPHETASNTKIPEI
jgi:hypothetical protein